jgi:hypothetical protein
MDLYAYLRVCQQAVWSGMPDILFISLFHGDANIDTIWRQSKTSVPSLHIDSQ